MFQEELIFIDQPFKDSGELFHHMGALLMEKGYVKEDYTKAVIEREENFPTGLQAGSVAVAIPHVDSKYIKKAGIAFVRPSKPIEFKEMCTNRELSVDIIFLLLVKDKAKQVTTLSALMSKFADIEFMEKLKREKRADQILSYLDTILEE